MKRMLLGLVLSLGLVGMAEAYVVPLGPVQVTVPYDCQGVQGYLQTNGPTIYNALALFWPTIEGQTVSLLGQQVGVAPTPGPWATPNLTPAYTGIGAGVFGLFVQLGAKPLLGLNGLLHFGCVDISETPATTPGT